MPVSDGRYTFDLHAEHPNVEIDTMRRAIVQAIDDLKTNAAGVDDAYWLSDLLFSLLDSGLAANEQLRVDLAALTARVTALEPPVFTVQEPTP